MLKVYGIMVLTMFLWGSNVSLLKILVSNIPPLAMQGGRILIAGITLFLILLVTKKQIIYKEMPWKYLMIACGLGVIIHHALLATGLQQTTSIKSSLILGLVPLLTAIIAVLIKSTTLTKVSLSGFIIGFLGIAIAVVDDFSAIFHLALGDIYVLGAAIVQAISFFVIRKITLTIPPIVVTAYMLTIGATMLSIYNLIANPKDFIVFTQMDPKLWGVLIYSAVFATAVGHGFYNSMIKRLGTAETAIFTNLSTIFALMGSIIILGEQLHASQIFGCLLIVTGVLVGTGGVEEWIRKRRLQAPIEGHMNEKSSGVN